MTNSSPAELVAIARAAHVVGDKSLEKVAKDQLREQFGIEIKFGKKKPESARA